MNGTARELSDARKSCVARRCFVIAITGARVATAGNEKSCKGVEGEEFLVHGQKIKFSGHSGQKDQIRVIFTGLISGKRHKQGHWCVVCNAKWLILLKIKFLKMFPFSRTKRRQIANVVPQFLSRR